MNNIEKLIEKLCPNGVEMRELGEVTKYEQPTKYVVKSTKYNDEYDTPVLTAGKTFILGYTDEKDGIYKASDNPLIIFDDFTTSRKWVDFDFKVKSSAMKFITSSDIEKYSIRYIYHFMTTIPMKNNFDHKRQWISSFSKIKIPIPPLEIQEEIVKILDPIVKLKETLGYEKELRGKQYNYYRDKLLNFDSREDVEWKELGEVFYTKNGYTPSKRISENWENGDVPFFKVEDIRVNGRMLNDSIEKVRFSAIKGEKLFEEDSIIFSTSATIGEYALIKVPFLCNQRFVVLTQKEDYKDVLEVNFLLNYFYIISKKTLDKLNLSTFPNIDVQNFKMNKIPIPSLSEQQKIVEILDKFEELIILLEKEIELRQKQYEYYREKLLKFNTKTRYKK